MQGFWMYVDFFRQKRKPAYCRNNVSKKNQGCLLVSIKQLPNGILEKTPGQFGIFPKLINLFFVVIYESRFNARSLHISFHQWLPFRLSKSL